MNEGGGTEGANSLFPKFLGAIIPSSLNYHDDDMFFLGSQLE